VNVRSHLDQRTVDEIIQFLVLCDAQAAESITVRIQQRKASAALGRPNAKLLLTLSQPSDRITGFQVLQMRIVTGVDRA